MQQEVGRFLRNKHLFRVAIPALSIPRVSENVKKMKHVLITSTSERAIMNQQSGNENPFTRFFLSIRSTTFPSPMAYLMFMTCCRLDLGWERDFIALWRREDMQNALSFPRGKMTIRRKKEVTISPSGVWYCHLVRIGWGKWQCWETLAFTAVNLNNDKRTSTLEVQQQKSSVVSVKTRPIGVSIVNFPQFPVFVFIDVRHLAI